MKNIGDFAPICINCFKIDSWQNYFKHLNKDFSGICSKCRGTTVKVDKNFIPIAKILWPKGYYTKFSCLGHYKKDIGYFNRAYIGFKEKINTIPDGWILDNETIRYKKNNPEKAFESLFNWSKNLPKLKTKPLKKYKPNPIPKNEYNSNVTFFFGESAFKKHYKFFFNDFTIIKNLKHIKDLSNHKRLVVFAEDMVSWVLLFESIYKFYKNDQKIILVFKMNKEKESNLIPSTISGWGAFCSKKVAGLCCLWLKKFNPKVLTGDQNKIYQVFYENKKQ